MVENRIFLYECTGEAGGSRIEVFGNGEVLQTIMYPNKEQKSKRINPEDASRLIKKISQYSTITNNIDSPDFGGVLDGIDTKIEIDLNGLKVSYQKFGGDVDIAKDCPEIRTLEELFK